MDAIEYSIEQGQSDGEFTKRYDVKTVVDMLCGPIFFRLMAHPADFNESFMQDYPAQALKLISA